MGPIKEVARKHNLPVIEDAAQAIGARYQGKAIGSIGTLGCFSFFPSKNLGGAGDGGLVATNDPALADRLKILRLHGCRQKYSYELLGINSRLDAIQAAILRVKLKYLDSWAECRRRNADQYRALLAASGADRRITLPVEPGGCHHVYNQFVIRTARRDALREYLKAAGIPTEIYYPSPLHLEKAYSFLGHKPGDFPESEVAAGQTLAIPIFAELTSQQLGAVAGSIASFFGLQE
jgi:dTDP-4-amino-4,6-dideoxygalactose transaminase